MERVSPKSQKEQTAHHLKQSSAQKQSVRREQAAIAPVCASLLCGACHRILVAISVRGIACGTQAWAVKISFKTASQGYVDKVNHEDSGCVCGSASRVGETDECTGEA